MAKGSRQGAEGERLDCDNSSAIQLSKNQVYHERTKHIDVKLHFIREEITRGSVKVMKISTDQNPFDIITKVCRAVSSFIT